MSYNEQVNASSGTSNFTLKFDTSEVFDEFMKRTKQVDIKIKVLKNKF